MKSVVVRFLAAIVFLSFALGGSMASAETIRETLESFGFFGTWATRCDEPASPGNNVRIAAVSVAGDPVFTESLGENSEENVYVILGAQRLGDDAIALRIKLNGTNEQELVMRRAWGRIRTFSNRDGRGGRAIVANGIVKSSGRATPWLTRCGDSSERRQEPQ